MTRAVMLSAKLWASAGFSVVRAYDDGTKRPFGEWKAGQTVAATPEAVEAWGDGQACYGLLTGYNGLEMFEFEGRAVAEGWGNAFEGLMIDNGLEALWRKLTDGPESYVERTPSGGIHVLYRVTGDGGDRWGFGNAALGNTKLANRPTTAEEKQAEYVRTGKKPGKQLVMIESRGVGGFSMTAPSLSLWDGKWAKQDAISDAQGAPVVLDDSQPRWGWVRTKGAPGVVPVISSDERDAMFAIAAMLDRMPVRESRVEAIGRAERLPWESSDGSSPRDDFEVRTDWAEILEPAGWVEVRGPSGQRGRYWRRPGKDAGGGGGQKGYAWSASTGREAERDRMYVWSTSTELDHEIPMTKSYVWGVVNGIPESEVAGRLRGLGYGAAAWADALEVEVERSSGNGVVPLSTEAGHSPNNDKEIHQSIDGSVEVDGEDSWDWSLGLPGAGTAVNTGPSVSTWIPDPVSGDDGEEVVGPEGVYLPESFWDARPVFGVLRAAARRALASPEGVLVAAIGLTLARVMPNVVLPACVGVEASLNLMIVTCGTSGDGKSVCRKIAKQTLTFPGCEALHEFSPSSGQGIAGQYQELKKPKGEDAFMKPLRWSALATVEESDKIAALASQASSTLSSELRAAAMGELIGSANVGDTKTNMAEGTYRFVLAMCMQPELSGWLLDEKAGGLPQRFLFACVNDARVVDAVDPGQWTVRLPFEAGADPVSGAPRGHRVMGITDAICAEIRAETIARKRASVRQQATTDYDGHGTLMRLKVAGAFALLDGRLSITDEDWRLAGEVAAASKATIRWMQSIQANTSQKKAEASRKVKAADAKAIKVAETETTESRERKRAADAILRKLGREPGGVSKRTLRQAVGTDVRGHADDVIFELEKVGMIRYENVEKDGKVVGSTWFLAG